MDVTFSNNCLDGLIHAGAPLTVSINALWLPAIVLAERDPPRCRRLIDRVLMERRADGLLLDTPAGRDGDPPVAAWPLWACVAETVQRLHPDDVWAQRILPAFKETFMAALAHLDPDRLGLPRWRSAEEAWDKRSYRANLAGPDVSTLLLLEADALQRLASQADRQVADERDQLCSGLLDFMADPQSGCFDARRAGGGRELAVGRMAVFPLLWPGLPGEWAGRLLKHAQAKLVPDLCKAGDVAALIEFRLWRRSLDRVGAHGLLNSLESAWRRKERMVSSDPASLRDIPTVTRAAAVLPPHAMTGSRLHITGLLVRPNRDQARRLFHALFKLDGRAMAAAIFLVFALVTALLMREPAVDAATLELRKQAARTAAALGNPLAGREIQTELGKAGAPSYFLDWLALERAEQSGEWDEALELYNRLRSRDGMSPLTVFGSARAKSRLGMRQEASIEWQMFFDKYGSDFPAAAAAGRRELWLMHAQGGHFPELLPGN